MNIKLCFLVSAIASMYGCGKPQLGIVNLALVERLERSSVVITEAGDVDYRALLQKQATPETKQHADRFMPMVKWVRRCTDNLSKAITQLKDEFNKDKNVDPSDPSLDSLFRSLANYSGTLYKIIPDSADRHMLLDDFAEILELKKIDQLTFKNLVLEGGPGYLAQLRNDLRTLESRILHFTNKRIGIVEDFPVTTAITGQNTKHLKRGDSIEIYAALLTVVPIISPLIRINRQDMPLNSERAVVYRRQVNGKPGQQTIPVQYTFTSLDGRKDSITHTISFTVDE